MVLLCMSTKYCKRAQVASGGRMGLGIHFTGKVSRRVGWAMPGTL